MYRYELSTSQDRARGVRWQSKQNAPRAPDKKGKGTCVAQNPVPPGYQAGAVIYARWSTADQALTGWIDLKMSIPSCGWRLLTAAWSQEPDSSYLVQVTAVPSLSHCTKATNVQEAIRQARVSLLRHLRRFEIEHNYPESTLRAVAAFIGPG